MELREASGDRRPAAGRGVGRLALLALLGALASRVDGDASGNPQGLDPRQCGLVRTLVPRGGDLYCVGFSPDGRWLAVGGLDHVVRLYETSTWREARKLEGHVGAVRSLAFHPEGRKFATGDTQGEIRFWKLESGGEDFVFTGHQGPVTDLSFNPDGTRLLSAGGDGTLRLWDVTTRAEARVLQGHQGMVYAAGWFAHGKRAVSSGQDGAIHVWDAETWSYDQKIRRLGDCFPPLAVFRDGRRLASAGPDHAVRVWNLESGEGERSFAHPARVYRLALTRDERLLVTAAEDAVRLWEMRGGTLAGEIRHHTGPVLAVAIHPSGRLFATAGTDRHVKVWGPAPGGLAGLRAKGFLGIRVQDHAPGGVVITDVIADTPAQRSGLLRGDVVRKVAGTAIGDSTESVDTIGSFLEGDELAFEIDRGGEVKTFKIRLGRRPGTLDK